MKLIHEKYLSVRLRFNKDNFVTVLVNIGKTSAHICPTPNPVLNLTFPSWEKSSPWESQLALQWTYSGLLSPGTHQNRRAIAVADWTRAGLVTFPG